MNNRFFILIICFIPIFSLSADDCGEFTSGLKGNIFPLYTVEGKNAFITFVMIDGVQYIIKQKRAAEKKQLGLLRDVLAADLAKDLDIAHQATMVSYKKQLAGKIFMDLPALILSIAKGDIVRNQHGTLYNKLRLSQKCGDEIPFQQQGLTRAIINQISWHEQLALIVALDLFIGNCDRHSGNLFYDPETDKFCAIDMDNTFSRDLCDLARKKLFLMVEKGEASFSEREMKALIRLKKHLHYFVVTYPPQMVIKKLYYFASKAGFVPTSPLYDKKIESKLLLYEEIITKTHVSARKLITLLNEIILGCM